MGTDDRDPRSVMSRGKGDGQVVHGARMIKHRRWTSPHRATWPAGPGDPHESGIDAQPAMKRQKRPRAVKEKSAKPVPNTTLMAAAASASSSYPAMTDYNGTPRAGG